MVTAPFVHEFLAQLERALSSNTEELQLTHPGDALEGPNDLIRYLEKVGILDSADAVEWKERLRNTQSGGENRLSAMAKKFRSLLAQGRAEWPSPSLDSSTVTVVAGPRAEVGAFRVLAIELYNNYVALRWLARPSPNSAGEELDIAITDDAGTKYRVVAVGRFGDPRMGSRGETVFVPAVPISAKELSIRSGDDESRVELPPNAI